MRYPFTFKVMFWKTPIGKYVTECGVTIAENYAQAAQYLDDYYGETLYSIEHLAALEENELILLPEKVMEGIENDIYFDKYKEVKK